MDIDDAGTVPAEEPLAPGRTADPVEPGTAAAQDDEVPAAEGRASRRRRKEKPPPPPGSLWRELPILIVVAVGLAILLKTFLLQAFWIPSGSMENTLRTDDRVMVNKVVYHLRDIKRGDIIVFDGTDSFSPETTVTEPTNPVSKAVEWFAGLIGVPRPSETDFIKRVIGIPGDHVTCCDAQGRVTVNGVALDEKDYLYPGNNPSDQPFDVRVPAGHLWVMGDHRALSSDSRAHLGQPGGGMVPEDKVIGRAFVVIWPVSHWSWLSNPETFDQPGLQSSATAAALTSPLALGLAAAFPVVGVRRRVRSRRHRRHVGVAASRGP